MKIQFSKFKKVLAITLLLALLVSLAALPAAGSGHNIDPCANATDYDQCVSGNDGPGAAPPIEQGDRWHGGS